MSCLPLQDLGTEYYIFTAGKANVFGVANGMEEAVWVNVLVSGTITFNGVQYQNQESFSFSLGYQQVIQFHDYGDLTGTRVTSTAPVAVFSGNTCFAGIGTACDALIEQVYPVPDWGRFFVVFPLLNHTRDVIDIMAGSSNTTVFVESLWETTQYTLHQGSHIRLTLVDTILVNASNPVMISYLIQESKPEHGIIHDPFFITVPPMLLTRKHYKFVTQDHYYNFLLVASEASSLSDFYLDHKPLSLYKVSSMELYGFRGWEVTLGKVGGQHEIYHELSAFSLYVYGIESYISYGYSLGQERTYPDPPLPKSTVEPDVTSFLSCLSDEAVYHLPLSLISEASLSVGDVHLEDPLCKAVQEGNTAVIKVPFNSCGSKVQSEEDKTVYINTIYGSIPGTNIHRIEVPVRCEMKRNETLGLNFYPKVTDVVSHGHYNISLKLHKSDAFNDPITAYPYELDLHGKLYVEFKVESNDQDLQIFTEDCKSSPSLEDTVNSYRLIQHGCSQDSTLQEYPVSDQREQHFSFHMFRFGDFQVVYLSCNVVICHNSTAPNRCTQGCISQRHRRDVHSSNTQLSSARLSQGPIVLKHGDQSQHSQDDFTFSSSVFVVTLCIFGLLSVVALMLQKNYYRMQGYSLVQSSCD
ncbi:uncharacterized protein WCC33_008918 [Rhinophrynus dorsalis]